MASEDKLREYLQRAAVDLADVRRRLAESDARQHEPIAIVGMSCRFADAPDPDALWDLLRSGRRAAIDDLPPGRFDHDPRAEDNDLYTPRRGSFLPDVAGWDAGFFGFSAREALRMDPQQRLLMELAWEAMEDAGTPPASLSGSRTGVLLGFSDAFQYGQLETERHGQAVYADPYMGQGSMASVVAGRLAYQFDLRGPAFSLDTACSSSLVAVHLAVQALRNQECDQALVGGAYMALHPFLYIHSCATSLLSPTDGCKTFDASADGYMMGEGGGMVMLARLSDALRNGRRIRAVIRGTAVNQDGRSNGLTAPNRSAQVEVIRQALNAAGATPDEIAYVEAHGSGTQLGDDIELSALQDVFGARAADRPLHVGAVKTNIGHTHTAAGIAGLVKSVLVLEHGVVPANLNMNDPVEALAACPAVRPATGLTPLPADGRPPIAGVSSFGWSGTNAHVVLETAPVAASAAARPAEPLLLLPVSAADDYALRESLTRLADGIDNVELCDVAHTLQSGRAQHRHRRAVVATDTAGAVARLTEAATTGSRRAAGKPRVAFLLPGVGDQYRGLGRSLYRSEPVFAAAVDTCADVLADQCGVDIRPLLLADPPIGQTDALLFPGRQESAPGGDDDLLSHAETAHPFLFTIEYALATLLGHRGVAPDVLVGYSLGEYVAACLAGVFTLPDALRVVTERARLIESAPEGRMLAVVADEQAVRDALSCCAAQVDIAALNGPQMTVLSGAPEEIDAIARHLAAAGVVTRVLRSAHAFHSALLRPAQDRLAALIAAVPRRAPAIPIVSNTTGRQLTDEEATDPQYWARHLCLPVRFAQSVQTCAARGVDAYVEVGPGQTLGSLVRQNLASAGTNTDAVVLGTLPAPWAVRGGQEEAAGLLETCGRLWELGAPLDWSAVAPQDGRLVGLPGYPFQRTRFWPERETADPARRQPELPAAGSGYGPVWRPDHARPATAALLTGTLVVFGHDTGIGPELADLAEAAGLTVIEVVPGTGLQRAGRRIVIDPAMAEHYREVIAATEDGGDGPLHVVHLWSLDAMSRSGVFAGDAELRAAVRSGFDSLLLTVQALSGLRTAREVRLLTVTAGSAEITGGDCTAPVQALAHGFGRSVRNEHRDLAWRGVDLHPAEDARQAAGALVQELRRGPWRYADPVAEPALVGWRGGRRWVKSWAELPLDESAAPDWDPDGAYLITGGTRGLGMALAKHLVRRGVRRLALVARTQVRRDTGDAPNGRQAQMLRDVAELESAGAEVLLLTADAGVPDELRAALRKGQEHFGALHAVIHAAGVPGGGWAQRQTTAGALDVLAPKVLAMGPLAELVGPDTAPASRPKLLVLYSSVITALGDLGQSDYCAANSVLDAYGTALADAAGGTQVLSVAWGQWQHDDWQRPTADEEAAGRVEYRERYGFTDEGGCALLDRLVGAVSGTVVATRQPLPEAQREWAQLTDLDSVLPPARQKTGTARFPRPPQRTAYVAPRSDLEAAVAEVWGEFLGIDRVGVNDPFFDLGGNSLVGVAMVTAIERLLDRRIAPAVLFAHPTVASFTAAVDPSGDAGAATGIGPMSGSARGDRRRRLGAQTAGTRK
jgi:acyl transferase domain-containing protein